MNYIKDLRKMTGAGFLDCKKALQENNNDIEKSVDFLRKKGLSKANKKSSREAKEGAIGIYSNKNLTTIIQINTETDFAAKNNVFLDFMDQIGSLILETNDVNLSIEIFKNLIFNQRIVNDLFKEIISKIGENIILNKLIIIQNKEDYMISKYIHNSYRKNIGKIAVVLKSYVSNKDQEAEILGKNLCMHIAASNPLAIDTDHLDHELIEKEKEVLLESIKLSGKPDNIVEKILDGKMKKFYSESVFMHQTYILDTEKTVKQIISEFSKKNDFKILDYYLLILGSHE